MKRAGGQGSRGAGERNERRLAFPLPLSSFLAFAPPHLCTSAPLLTSLPILAFLAFALIYPLGRILALGIGEGLGATLSNPYYWGRLGWSLTYGLGSSLLVVLLALPLAYAFRYRFPGREGLLAFSAVPFVLPTIVVAMGFLGLVGPKGVLGVNLYGTPWILFWASVLYNLGLVLRTLVGLLPGLESSLAAARTLGATPVRAFIRVGIPLLAPALLSGGSLVFLYSFTSFGVPLLLGGPGYTTLEVETYTALAYRLAFPEATALILMQLLVSLPLMLLYLRFQERYSLGIGTYGEPKPLPNPWPLSATVWGFFLLLYSPLLGLLIRALAYPQAWTSVWVSEDFTPAGRALFNTLSFAGLALLLVIPVGVLYAYAVWRGNRVLDWLGLLPLMISPVAVGLGYLLSYSGLRGSLALLIAAYALLSYPLLARALLPSLRAMPGGVVEAARTLGARPWRRFWRIEWPLTRPAFVAGVALALAAVVGEFGATLVLQRPEWATVTVAIYERLGRPGSGPFGEALVLSVLLMLASAGLFWLLRRQG